MTELHVGTSGWHYAHWKGVFYPPELRTREWFAYYARVFSTVELNNSFYRQPSASTWDGWREATPPGFRYAVKANRFLTHIKRFKDCEKPLETFLGGAERLKSYLGPVLYQAPPNFKCNPESFERLEAFFAMLPRRLTHVMEFRDDSWFGDETLELLRRHNVALCVQDMPGLHCPSVRTADCVYVRLHGGGEKAYQGNYSEKALEDWTQTLLDLMGGGAKSAWVYFNNDPHGYAVQNAIRLGEMLGVRQAAEGGAAA